MFHDECWKNHLFQSQKAKVKVMHQSKNSAGLGYFLYGCEWWLITGPPTHSVGAD